MQDSLLETFSHTRTLLLDAYHKYRNYYDKNAAAKPLVLHEYCLLLNPSLTTQSDFAAKSTTIWLSLYRVKIVLTKSNYLIRKVGTPYTQCVHRIRLRPIKPNYDVEDIQVTLDEFRPDPSLGKYRSEHQMFDEALEQLSQEGRLYDPNVVKPKSSVEAEVEYLISGAAVAPPNTAPTAPLVPTPPAPASAPLTENVDQLFPEPAQLAAPTQVHTDKPRLGVRSENTENEYLSEDKASFASSANMNHNEMCSSSSRKPTSQQRQTTSRKISFDQYDYSRGIPNRHELTKSGYYSYLDKLATTSSTDTKREFLRKIASNTRENL